MSNLTHSTDSIESLEDNQAIFKGEPVEKPLDLFIPPDALEVWLDEFAGPLDLLLHLIRKNNFDILDIPIAEVTTQYMEYIEYIEKNRFELATEYLVMAAWLAEIKSRILLPKPPSTEDDEIEEDPRLELIKRLQIYARYKQVAHELHEMPRLDRDIHLVEPELPPLNLSTPPPTVALHDLVYALEKLLKRAELKKSHTVTRERISVHERMSAIVERITNARECTFEALFDPEEGRYGITISFLAILELTRKQIIALEQNDAYDTIHIRPYERKKNVANEAPLFTEEVSQSISR